MPSGIYIRTEDNKRNLSLSKMGDKNPKYWLGKKRTEEMKNKQRISMVGRNIGDKNKLWKGDFVSYRNLHRWVIRNLGKAILCENNINHLSTRYHWANKSGEYKRELSDWVELCPSCNKLDGVKINLRFYERGEFA